MQLKDTKALLHPLQNWDLTHSNELNINVNFHICCNTVSRINIIIWSLYQALNFNTCTTYKISSMLHKNLSSWCTSNFLSLYCTFILKYFYYFRKPSHKKNESEIVINFQTCILVWLVIITFWIVKYR